MCKQLEARVGIKVSQPTRCRAVQRLKMPRKKTLYASEQDTPAVRTQCDDYRRWLEQVDVRNLVFTDEVGVHLGMTRLWARTHQGKRSVDKVPRSRGTNFSRYFGAQLRWLDCLASSAPNGSCSSNTWGSITSVRANATR